MPAIGILLSITGQAMVLAAAPQKPGSFNEFHGIDRARIATAIASSHTADARYLNDHNSHTGWRSPGPGAYVQYAWNDAQTISGILVQSAGPLRDYTLKASTDGTNWTDVKQVTSAETGHTHWMDLIHLAKAISAKYIRLVVNNSDAGPILAIECYGRKGIITGHVPGVAGTTVYVHQPAGTLGEPQPSRLQIKGTTLADGSYSVAFPEGGPVVVTAVARDTSAITSAEFTVSANSDNEVPPLRLIRPWNSKPSFHDNFDDGRADLCWDTHHGSWRVQDGHYMAAGDTVNMATVKDFSTMNCVIRTDAFGPNMELIARYQDPDNYLVLRRTHSDEFFWSECHDGKWKKQIPPVCVAGLDNKPVRIRATVTANVARASISDGSFTYWTKPFLLDHIWKPGKAGLGCDKRAADQAHYFDNYSVRPYTFRFPDVFSMAEINRFPLGWRARAKGIVTAVCADHFVVEAKDRCGTLQVEPVPKPAPAIGEEVIVSGAVARSGVLRLFHLGRMGWKVKPTPDCLKTETLPTARDDTGRLVTVWGRVLNTPLPTPDGAMAFNILRTEDDYSPAVGNGVVYVPYRTVFEDNFDAGRKVQWKDVPGEWPYFWGRTRGESGKLVADASENMVVVTGDEYRSADQRVAVEARCDPDGIFVGILLRYNEPHSFVLVFYTSDAGRLAVQDVHGRGPKAWGDQLGLVSGCALDPTRKITMVAEVKGDQVTASITDGLPGHTYRTTCRVAHNLGAGYAGLFHVIETVECTTAFDNFVAQHYGLRAVPANALQVVIPAGIARIPLLHESSFVAVTGITGMAECLSQTAQPGGRIRSVTIDKAADLVPY